MSEIQLSDLAAGDTVVYQAGRWNHNRAVKIDRVTNTQIVIGNERFRRDGGYRIGDYDSYNRIRISVPKDGEIVALQVAHRKWQLASQLSDVKWGTLSLEALESVSAIVARDVKATTEPPKQPPL